MKLRFPCASVVARLVSIGGTRTRRTAATTRVVYRSNQIGDGRAVENGNEHVAHDAEADGSERDAERVAVERRGLHSVGRVRVEHARHQRERQREKAQCPLAAHAREHTQTCTTSAN